QHRIVAKIEELFTQLDAGVAELEQAKARLKQYRQSVLKAAVEGELTREWREARLAQVRVKHLPDEATGKLGADGQMLHPNEDASQLLQRILAERRAKWETAQWAKEIERAQKKAAQAKRRAEGKPARIRDLQPEEWGAIIEAEYARYLPKNDKWKAKYKEPAAPDTAGLAGLPEGWCWGSVGQIGSLIQYGTSAKADLDETGIPVLRMGNIRDGELDFEKLKYLSKNTPKIESLILQSGDILFNRTNSAELVGKTAIYKQHHPEATFASYLIRVKIFSPYSPDFVAFYINSFHGRRHIASVVSQQVGQANVNGTKLANFPIPFPPIIEMEQIVRKVERRLSVADEIEKELDEALLRAARLRQSVLKRAFAGELVRREGAEVVER
ncbi:MAG: hypothetical protein GY803_27500, partial [Chloroflexi bacterium]|nr:hypothetical protein [Chloroflexota bacterium]